MLTCGVAQNAFVEFCEKGLLAAQNSINVVVLFHGLGHMNPADVKRRMCLCHPQQPRAKLLLLQDPNPNPIPKLQQGSCVWHYPLASNRAMS